MKCHSFKDFWGLNFFPKSINDVISSLEVPLLKDTWTAPRTTFGLYNAEEPTLKLNEFLSVDVSTIYILRKFCSFDFFQPQKYLKKNETPLKLKWHTSDVCINSRLYSTQPYFTIKYKLLCCIVCCYLNGWCYWVNTTIKNSS